MKEGWEYKKLGELFDITSSKRVFQSEWKTSGVPFYRAREIVQLSKNGYVDNELFITKELYSEYTEKYGKPQKGDIMVTGVGTLGICYLVKDNDKFYFKDGNIIWLRKKSDNLSEYIEYAFKSYFVKSQVENSSGATVGTYTIVRANKTIVPIPRSISEQQHIVEELDLLSSIIEKKKAQLNELDNLAQSLFYEMFGDPITNEKGWEVKKLKEACTCITDGDHMPPPKVDKGIPFITISNINKQNREIDFRETFFVPLSYYDSIKEERKAQIDDVLYTVTGSYGIPIIVNEDRKFCFQRHIALLRPNKHMVNSCYLCYWALCKRIKYMADDVATGIAQKTVGLSSLREFPIIIPPLALQQQFASKIEAIEHQKELIKQSIKEVETLFNSRMDYYFN